jgi:hypothetical protein
MNKKALLLTFIAIIHQDIKTSENHKTAKIVARCITIAALSYLAYQVVETTANNHFKLPKKQPQSR